MAKTYRWYDKQDPRKTTQKAKQDKKIQGRINKQFLRSINTGSIAE